ncbi:hypothetical protein CPB83DRAFT_847592 [Crepidotus variabilis]|uniref:Phosphatidylinositol N-acetylglucosaminyltransferase subunit H conserved domain-containing protein n=1 Tax=Crepidotus variabilis TaxID=179855 RepID=A0A9P6ENV6_9AGAR|nr:hypothetical protein CPB83DRAFT_847592 [Crepidotus variabilis]
MSISQPLPDHPELLVFEYPSYREYRITPKKKSPNPNYTLKWMDNLLYPIILAFLWQKMSWKVPCIFSIIYILYIFKFRVLTLQHESVILLPPHGIQLETHWGISRTCSMNIKRKFIPAIKLTDAIIHEGLYGWNVLYYLAAVTLEPSADTTLHVAFEEMLPCHDILLEVYEGIYEIMLSKSADKFDKA